MSETATKPGEARAMTQIVVTDSRIIVAGHSWNKAACVAIAAIVQTTARIAAYQGLLAAPCELTEGDNPLYDIKFVEDSERARQIVAGFVASGVGLARTAPGTLLFSDNRRTETMPAPIPEGFDSPAPAHDPEIDARGGYDEAVNMAPKPLRIFQTIDGRSARLDA